MANHRWVFLRGLARERGHWGSFPELFQKSHPNSDVECLDLPGIGLRAEAASPVTMAAICESVRAEAFSRDSRPVRLLSISLGSMVAMEWMRTYPHEVEAAVLINTSTKKSGPFYQRLRWQAWSRFVQILLTQKPRERERAIVDLLMNNQEAREAALPLWAKIAIERPAKIQTVMTQLAAASRFEGLSESPRMPVLLLSGLGDRLVDPGNSEVLHQQWECPLKRHPWAGHDLPWDDPLWVVQSVTDWLSSIERDLNSSDIQGVKK